MGGDEWLASPTGLFTSGRDSQVPTELAAGWASQPVWRLLGENKSVASTRNQSVYYGYYTFLEWIYNDVSVKQKKNFIIFIILLGQHVSILIESSSGPSKIQILT